MSDQPQTKITPEEILSKREELFKVFEAKAKELSDIMKVDVSYETFTELDSDGEPTGNVFVVYVRQPHLMVAARAMDFLVNKKFYEAGSYLYDLCVIKEHSSPEVERSNKMKLGLQGRLGTLIDLIAPDVKKLEQFVIDENSEEFTRICVFLRYHFKMDIKSWNDKEFSEDDVYRMWFEYIFVKKQLGEIKEDE